MTTRTPLRTRLPRPLNRQLPGLVQSLAPEALNLTEEDLTILFACSSQAAWEPLYEALVEYPALNAEFLRNPADPAAFSRVTKTLLTMIYGHRAEEFHSAIQTFLKEEGAGSDPAWLTGYRHDPEGFKSEVIYELYVDLFAGNFRDLITRLPYFSDLGVTTLWLLPFLDTPGDDAGFDQRDRYNTWARLGSLSDFQEFAAAASRKGFSIMMDLVLNHRSWESVEFQASSDPGHPQHAKFRDYFIWHKGDGELPPARYAAAASMFENIAAPTGAVEF